MRNHRSDLEAVLPARRHHVMRGLGERTHCWYHVRHTTRDDAYKALETQKQELLTSFCGGDTEGRRRLCKEEPHEQT